MGTAAVRGQPILLLATLLLAFRPLHADDQNKGLPTDWRKGIATFYGGAPDGMVSFNFLKHRKDAWL